MGLFDWLAKHAIKSNDKFDREMRAHEEFTYNEKKREENYKNSLECCANCIFFRALEPRPWGEYKPYCGNHHFYFDDEFAKSGRAYTKTCVNFFRKNT